MAGAEAARTVFATAEFWSAIAGAVVGTLGAGGVSAVMAMLATRDRRKAELEARRNNERALAVRLTLKTKLFVDDAYSTLLGLKRQLGSDWDLRGPALGAKLLPTMAGDAYEVRFDQDEMAFLHGSGHADLLNDLIVYDQRHSVFGTVMKLYAERRRELIPYLRHAAEGKASYVPAESEVAQFNLLVHELGDLADNIVEGSVELYRDGIRNMGTLASAMRAHFNDPKFPAGEIDVSLVDPLVRAEVEAAQRGLSS